MRIPKQFRVSNYAQIFKSMEVQIDLLQEYVNEVTGLPTNQFEAKLDGHSNELYIYLEPHVTVTPKATLLTKLGKKGISKLVLVDSEENHTEYSLAFEVPADENKEGENNE